MLPWELHAEELSKLHPYAVFTLRGMLAVPYFEKALYELPDGELSAAAIRVCFVHLPRRPTPARLSAGLSRACRLARRSARRGRTLGAALASGAHVLLGQRRGRLQGSASLHQLRHRLSGSHPCRSP